MKRKSIPLFAGLSLLLASTGALADENTRQVWHDSEKQIVHNTWGTCVRSRWNIGVDPCAPPPSVVTCQAPPPPPAPHTIIAAADRTVYFPFNVATLTPDSQQLLDQLAQRINSSSDIQNAQVVGYADRIGTTSYNEALSKRRAENVRDYLIGRNVITEKETMTRWVGKSESNTQCAPNLSHEQLIQCLAPDRKVTVELKYKQQVIAQPPQASAPPPPPPPYMGQPPLAPTAAAHAVPLEVPHNVSPQYPPYPMEKNGVVPAYPLEQSAVDQMMPASVQTYPVPPQPTAPANAPSPSVQTYPLQQSSADQAGPQPNSASPAAYTMQANPEVGQYAEAEYRAEYPLADHPDDRSGQPSDEYRERYLTTGE